MYLFEVPFDCDPGYYGPSCLECPGGADPETRCGGNGICDDGIDGSGTCECFSGWQGPLCGMDVDECATGTDDCDVNASCENIVGSFECTCDAGYVGDGVSCSPIGICCVGFVCEDSDETSCANEGGDFDEGGVCTMALACCLPDNSCVMTPEFCCTAQGGTPGEMGDSCDVDTDGDGVANICDPCPDDNPDDGDGDGVCESDDICIGGDDNIDSDGDGVPNFCDQCPGEDDIADDSDGDGVCDSDDVCPGGNDNVDTDADGVPDFCDHCPGEDDTLDENNDGYEDCLFPTPVPTVSEWGLVTLALLLLIGGKLYARRGVRGEWA